MNEWMNEWMNDNYMYILYVALRHWIAHSSLPHRFSLTVFMQGSFVTVTGVVLKQCQGCDVIYWVKAFSCYTLQ